MLRFRTCEIRSNGSIRIRGFCTKRDLERAESPGEAKNRALQKHVSNFDGSLFDYCGFQFSRAYSSIKCVTSDARAEGLMAYAAIEGAPGFTPNSFTPINRSAAA